METILNFDVVCIYYNKKSQAFYSEFLSPYMKVAKTAHLGCFCDVI